MRKAFRHTGVLMMVGVVALGLLGAAYTLWYEKLTLDATVTTGSVDVNWSIDKVHPSDGNWTSDEIVKAPGFSGEWFHLNVRTPGGSGVPGVTEPLLSKYVQDCSIDRGPGETTEPANPSQHTLVIKALGLYPYAGCEFAFNIENNGTVPVHLTQTVASTGKSTDVKLVVGGVTADSNLPQAEAEAVCTDVLNMWLNPADNLLGTPLTWMDGTTSKVIQLHKGDRVNCFVWFYLAQDSKEGASINIVSTLTAHQWNENVPVASTRTWSAALNYSSTGWGGWSCPAGTHVVGGGVSGTSGVVSSTTYPFANSLAWKPGASVGASTYPATPFGYTYTPPEEGWIAQANGPAGQTAWIYLDCIP